MHFAETRDHVRRCRRTPVVDPRKNWKSVYLLNILNISSIYTTYRPMFAFN